MENIKTIGLRSIYAQLQPRDHRPPLHEIELPPEVLELANNKSFHNRYKWLQREYGLEFMLRVAKMANKLGKNPVHYFATLCSKANIDKTVKTIKEYYERAKAVAEVIISRPTVFKGFIYKNVLQLSSERIRNALARSSDAINQGATFVLLTKL